MKRFHKSILGLMEQSNTGDWIKYEDFLYEKEVHKQSFLVLCDEISELKLKKKKLHIIFWFVISLLVIFLIFSNTAKAATKQEEICVAKSIYFEGRSESKTIWENMYQVAINRSKNPKQFKAKSSNLCDVVHSKHYKTHKLRTIKDVRKYKEILTIVKQYHPKAKSKILYFASSTGKIKFRTTFKG